MNVKFKAGLAAVMAISMAMADGLPEGYTQLPFVKASGQCRVRTGLLPAGTDKAELTFELSTVSGNQNLWCSRSGSTGQFTTFMIADKVRFDRYTNQVTTAAALVPAKKYTVTADYATGVGVVTDVAAGTTAASAEMDTDEYLPVSELCLFASHTTDVETGLGNYGSWTFYSFKLRDADGNLRCDLVPARLNSDGVIGLYDTVRSTFLANDLDGELTLGTGYSFDDNGNLLVAISVVAQGNGAIRVGEGEAAATALVAIRRDGTESATLTAVPDEGCRFFNWVLGEGAELTQGTLTDTTITISATKPVSIKAVFYAPADICAKLVDGAFHYYKDDTCLPESELLPEDAPESIAGVRVVFANDAEYKALVPFTNELATALGGLAQLQKDVTLTDDTDWRDMEFNMNGKTITLKGWDLQVHKPQGSGRITAGNILNPDGYVYSSGASADANWIYLGAGSTKGGLSSRLSAKQTFTLPKSRTCYFKTQTKRLNSNWAQYVRAGITGTDDVMAQTGNLSGTQTRGPFVRTGLNAGTSYTIKYYWTNGKCYISRFSTFSQESHLYFDIPEGEEYDTSNLTLGGSSPGTSDYGGLGLQVYKTGKGSLVMSRANGDFAVGGRRSGNVSVIVDEGVAKQSATVGTASCGTQYSTITVEDGGQFDLSGRIYHDYDYVIAGSGPDGTGALVNTVEVENPSSTDGSKRGYLQDVTLAADATIYAAEDLALLFYDYGAHTMTMGGNTVTFDCAPGKRIYSETLTYSGEGKIVVAPNATLQFCNGTSAPASNCVVEVHGTFETNGKTLTAVKALTFLEGSKFNCQAVPAETMVVAETYAPNGTWAEGTALRHPKVQLGDADHLATTFDISHLTEPLDDREEGTLSFYFKAEEVPASDPGTGDSGTDDPEAGGDDDPPDPPQVVVTEATSVTVEIGDRKEGLGKPALLWKEAPPYEVMSRFRSSVTMKRRGIFIEVRDDGIYFVTGTTLIIR